MDQYDIQDLRERAEDQAREYQRIQNLSPEDRAIHDAKQAAYKANVARRVANDKLFFDGGDFLSPAIKPGSSEYIEKIREASFNGDWQTLFAMRPWNHWRNIPLGKFRFEWVNGKPKYKPMSQQDFRNYFSGPWINITGEFGGTCPEERINKYTHDYYHDSLKNLRKRGPDHPHHIRRVYPKNIICRPKQKSTWVKIRHKVAVAVAVVAAVYLGPQIVAKVKSIAGGGAAGGTGGTGSLAANATTFQKVQAGTKTMLGYVNKARTIEAIAKGELPPPPIGIVGTSFTDWAMIAVKEEVKNEAVEAAMNAGQKYIAKKMTQKEEAALRAEIEAMQREINALIPPDEKKAPPQPAAELPAPIKTIQIVEEKKRDDFDKYLLPAAMVAGAIILGA